MQKKVNPEMITLARKAKGISQKEFSEVIGVSPGELSKFEHGLRVPNRNQMVDFAKKLGFPLSFFYQNEQILPTTDYLHRKRTTVSRKVMDSLIAKANIFGIAIGRLLQQVEINSNIPRISPDEMGPNEIARAVRYSWKISGKVNNMANCLEDNGVIVLEFDFECKKMDGFSINDHNPIIFLNSYFPTDRKRRTLAHELGHIIMHDRPTGTCEQEADDFASEFLLPESIVHYDLSHLNLRKLALLKRSYGVSMQALIMRAFELGKINDKQKRNLFINLSKKGLRRDEGVNIPAEKTSLLREIVTTHYDNGYSREELAKLVNLPPGVIRKYFLQEPQRHFHVVKI